MSPIVIALMGLLAVCQASQYSFYESEVVPDVPYVPYVQDVPYVSAVPYAQAALLPSFNLGVQNAIGSQYAFGFGKIFKDKLKEVLVETAAEILAKQLNKRVNAY